MVQSAAARDGPIDELRLLAGICSWIDLNGVYLTDMIADVEKLCRDIDDATIIRTFRINEADWDDLVENSVRLDHTLIVD
ncbi:hypothetical protein CMUS01_12649 [Colletotrichum musicola]|uniref:Uncharacterized protein n=1 Tax=Colletotrichum musicola TaxID=2175873 RepID=A0A8H6JK61_9PEZI|nr:hypothetical protein CMUS01_12649 [Colletotrichum musicola]